MLEEAVNGLLSICEFDCDVILAPEAMGISLASAISLKTGIPFAVIRKREYGLPGEIPVHSDTGYSSRMMYINGVKAGDTAMLVDDMISTGGTMKKIVSALTDNGIKVSEVGIVFNKAEDLSTVIPGINVRTLVNIRDLC